MKMSKNSGNSFVDDEGVLEEDQLTSELEVLQEKIAELKQSTASQSATAAEDLTHWEEYQKGVAIVMPWLEAAETRIAQGPKKSATLTDAQNTLAEWIVSQTSQSFSGHVFNVLIHLLFYFLTQS